MRGVSVGTPLILVHIVVVLLLVRLREADCHLLRRYLNLFLGLHVGVHGLYIIEVLKFLHHFVDSLALLGGHVLQVVGDAGELGTGHLEALGLPLLLKRTIPNIVFQTPSVKCV